jgi:SAM-dependent methyltransferase
MVCAEDVRAAYRLILGREPENEEVLARHARQAASVADLMRAFLGSPEFRGRTAAPLPFRPLHWPQLEVEVDASPSQLAAIMRHIESNWQRLGLSEPHWSVVTAEEFRASNIATTEQRFFETGKDFGEVLQRTAERCGVGLGNFATCFELGCGLGRLTVWLADLFERVVAADISRPHLDRAREALNSRQRTNVDLFHINSFGAIDAVPAFDVFISVIVLQHNPPPLIAALLKAILSKLRPGGIAYFQVPTYSPGYRFHIDEYLHNASFGGDTQIEMHVIPQHRLFDILERSGCCLLECREDAWVSGIPEMISNSIFVKKQEQT